MCQSFRVNKSLRQRWTALLGIIAMLGVLIAVPAVTAIAATPAMAQSLGVGHDMPCEKPCPACPKVCADMAGCLAKCFQSIPPIAISGEALPSAFVDVLQPSGPSALGDRLIPPLLRPPSI